MSRSDMRKSGTCACLSRTCADSLDVCRFASAQNCTLRSKVQFSRCVLRSKTAASACRLTCSVAHALENTGAKHRVFDSVCVANRARVCARYFCVRKAFSQTCAKLNLRSKLSFRVAFCVAKSAASTPRAKTLYASVVTHAQKRRREAPAFFTHFSKKSVQACAGAYAYAATRFSRYSQFA